MAVNSKKNADQSSENELTTYNQQLQMHQEQFLTLLGSVGLPTDNIFVPTNDRLIVFSHTDLLLSNIDLDKRSEAIYVAKFLAAVSVGLFDAALNYIWDETIRHLRLRVQSYDVEYFYDIAVSADKRKDVKTFEDIVRLTDDELLKGALRVDLITEAGYRNMDLVRYMRNNASAAHPNQLNISGLKLVSMAEDCLKEVISTPIPAAAILVQKLLDNIKTTSIREDDARDIATYFHELGSERIQRLAAGMFGIFVKRTTTEDVRQNIRNLAPLLWPFVDESTRQNFGIRHAYFSANNHTLEKNYAREFLVSVDGLSYITDQLRVAEVSTVLDQLASAHAGMNNFYNEILPAQRLASVIGASQRVPKAIEEKYVTVLVDVFLTNGFGTAWAANDIYIELIKAFTPRQAVFGVALVFDEAISSKLQISKCADKYQELVDILESKIKTRAGRQFISGLKSSVIPLSNLRTNKNLREVARAAVNEQL